jgi:hypothetical protein
MRAEDLTPEQKNLLTLILKDFEGGTDEVTNYLSDSDPLPEDVRVCLKRIELAKKEWEELKEKYFPGMDEDELTNLYDEI